jgi:acyl-CoA synthetase (AMP-forming)/AMP-acid ligase II
MHTPYGATEALPISTIEAREVLAETAAKTDAGGGVCVGRKFDSIDWRVIRITDDPVPDLDAEVLPNGQIGELIVRGPQVTPGYMAANDEARMTNDQCQANPSFLIRHSSFNHSHGWHPMGDVGYIDPWGRFWYCGRKSHRVEIADGTLFTEQVEAIINVHPAVRRSALVGVGARGAQTPIVIVEPSTSFVEDHGLDFEIMPYVDLAKELLARAAANAVSAPVKQVLFYPQLPVDVRHNAKINREALAEMAVYLIRRQPSVAAHRPPASSLQSPA